MSTVTFTHREPIGSSTYPMPDGDVDKASSRDRLSSPADAPGLATVYVHIPFCDQICSFCGFNKYISSEDVKEAYVEALIAEVEMYASTAWVSSLEVAAVYLGGGTPNALSGDQLDRILSRIRSRLPLTSDCEITCEGTPMNFTDDRIESLKNNGVQRVSAGIQTFDREIRSEHLQMREGKDELLGYIDHIKRNFDRFNLDMIFNLPNQTDAIWEDDLKTVLGTGLRHLTVYPLVLLEKTRFYSDYVLKDRYPAPKEDREIKIFRWTQEQLAPSALGKGRYTVRDWAHEGHECKYIDLNARSNHVLALGAGAHGFIAGFTYRNVKAVKSYIDTLGDRTIPYEVQRFCTAQDEMQRFMVMGLRLLELDLTEFTRRFGEPWEDHVGSKLADMVESGYITLNGSSVRYTDAGLLWANNVRSYFEQSPGGVVGYSDTLSIGKSGKDHYSTVSRVKATDAETG